MSLLTLHLLGSPVLRQESAEVTAFDDETRRFIADMFETMAAVGKDRVRMRIRDAVKLVKSMPEEEAKPAQPQAKLVLLPDANHVLKSVPGDDQETNLASYSDPSHPLARGIVENIAGFLRAP